MTISAIVLSVIALFIFSISSVIQKRVSTTLGGKQSAIFLVCIGLLPIFIVYLFAAPNSFLVLFNYKGGLDLLLAMISGLFFAAGYAFYLKGLETQQVSSSVAIGRLQNIMVIVFSIFILNESFTQLELIGGIMAFAGVYFVATDKGLKLNKALLPIVIAQVSWAICWMFLSFSITQYGSSYAPMFVSRLVATAIVLVLYFPMLFKGITLEKLGRKSYYLMSVFAIAAGILDGTGNSVLGYIAILNHLAVANIILSLSPLIVMIAAYILYKEKLTKLQTAGIVLAVLGVIIVSL